ncbi:MAG: hypothetical protein IT300_04345 [Dehalococcoidia bacterium]|nr:hypothetical protein [Dehalococcoidia bacterium]
MRCRNGESDCRSYLLQTVQRACDGWTVDIDEEVLNLIDWSRVHGVLSLVS